MKNIFIPITYDMCWIITNVYFCFILVQIKPKYNETTR